MIDRRRLAAGLALAGLSLTALMPLFSWELPRSADGRAHLFRLAAAAHAWEAAGAFLPRFAPELAFGFGYPLFNYYSPLVYGLGLGLQALGLPAVLALHAIFALALAGGALGAWGLARAWFGGPGALAAAGAYLFAPYLLFDVYTRGAAPEILALAILPWALWALSRTIAWPSPFPVLGLALSLAALWLTHTITALAGSGLLAAWFLVEHAIARRASPHPPAWPAVAALGLGLGAAALFWLPAFLETGLVRMAALTTTAGQDFSAYFLSVGELLRPTFTFDPRLEPPAVPPAFGLGPAAAALGALALWRRHPAGQTRCRVAALALGLAGLLLLSTSLSRPIWEALPPLAFVQFPWRFLGPASLLAALLAGAAASALWPWRLARWPGLPLGPGLVLAAVAAAALLAFPWTFVTRYPAEAVPADPSLTTILDYEVESGTPGLTSAKEFLPASVLTLPDPGRFREALAAGQPPDRLERDALPAGVNVLETASHWLAAEATFQAEQPFTAVFAWFFFPGWRAEVDGQPAPVSASGPHGLVGVAVPAPRAGTDGIRLVRVYFDGGTPLRQAAAGLSGLSLTGLAWLVWRRRPRPAAPAVPITSPTARGRWGCLAWPLLGLLLVVVRGWAAECRNPFCRSPFDGQAVAGAAHRLDLDFGGRLNLIGLDPPAPAPADQALSFTLYWRLFAPVAEDYSVAVQLWDAAGHLVGQQDAWHPGGQPTHRWLAGSYARDAHALVPFPGTAPGVYRLMIGVYPAEGGNLEVRNADGLPLGRFYEAGAVTVLAPTRPPTDAELQPAQALAVALGPVSVIGVDGLGRSATAGDALPVVLYYRLTGPAPAGARLLLDLADAAAVLPLASLTLEAFPVVRQPLTVLIPPEASGPAEVRVSLADAAGGRLAGPAVLGVLAVGAPARSYAPPAPAVPLALRLGDGADLLGFDLAGEPAQPGGTLTVTLYWRAAARLTTAYTVFVHLLGPDGGIAAQVDETPAQGARPTTGWLPPEVIADVHTLTLPAELPPGIYSLTAGLYDPRSGARLTVRDAAGQPLGDAVSLATIALAAGPP